MLKSLWFMAKVIALVAIAVWVAEQPGQAELVWRDYTITVQMGAFISAIIVLLVVTVLLYRFYRAIMAIPVLWRRHLDKKAREKGLRALTVGLAAVAAGDAKKARKQAQRVRQYWPDERGLPDLLEAQLARLEGREEAAQTHFRALMEYDDAAFLGVRGLLQSALAGHNDGEALALSRKALKLYPHQEHILRLVYDLEIKAQNWAAAEDILAKALKYGGLDKEQADSDKLAMLLLRAVQERHAGNEAAALHRAKVALKINPVFSPAVALAARLYTEKKQYTKATKLIEKAWKEAPHPEMVGAYMAAIDPKKALEPMAKTKHVEKLLKANRDHLESRLAAARVCVDMALWGEGRKHLDAALRNEAEVDSRAYALRALLEERAGSPFEEVQKWREGASDAPPSPAWVCRVTGRVYKEWQAIVMPHGSFNTLQWGDPNSGAAMMRVERLSSVGGGAFSPLEGDLLDAPVKLSVR